MRVPDISLDATLLLVDDRIENLQALEAVLEPLGYELVTARSGEEALKRLLTHDISVILLDVLMPGMDGYETASHIKQRERTRDIPIIFLTAMSTDASAVIQAFSTGAVDYVTKPFDPELLRAKVRVLVDLAQKTEMLKRQSALLAQRLDEHYATEARHLRRLAEAALVINSTLSLGEMLQVINESARDVIGAHQAETLVTVGHSGGVERSRSHSGKYAAWAASGFDVDLEAAYGVVWDRREPVRMTRKEIESSFASLGLFEVAPGHPMLEGWLAVPLVGRTGRALGLIQVADKIDGEFDEDDEVVLVQLAQLAAVAIENAERFQQEHLIAATLQRAMLPQSLPAVPGLELASRYVAGGAGTEVGGDWYDVVRLDDGRVLLAVGDVIGRGAQAAAIMGQLRVAMRAYALQQLPPTVLMRSLDRLLQDVTDSSMATAACLVLDPRTGRLEVITAGHPPPLVIDPEGRSSYIECDPHTPLGVLEAPLYNPMVMTLVRGSTVLLYTDGLVEAPWRPLDEGMAQLPHAVPPLPVDLETMADTVLTSMLGGDSSDDVALLAVRLT